MNVFLSLQDPRELPKGTRDPLGFEVIWTGYGRKVVGNLTTITTSIDEFITALLGFYLSEPGDSSKQEERFVRYEQIAAYLRLYNDEKKGGFVRGVTKTSERLKKLKDGEKVIVSANKRDQILSNQSAYGLWGLYSTALQDSGLIEERKISDTGKQVVEQLIANQTNLLEFLKSFIDAQEREVDINALKKYSAQFIILLYSPARKKILQFLLEGKKHEIQREFFYYLENSISINDIQDIWELIPKIVNDPNSPEKLKAALKDIVDIDQILTVCNNLFDYLRLPEIKSKSLSQISEEVAKESNMDQLRLPNQNASKYLAIFVDAWNKKDYVGALTELLNIHEKTMLKRGSAAWVEIDEKNWLKQRVEQPKAVLNLDGSLHSYSYFISSLISLFKQYRGSANEV